MQELKIVYRLLNELLPYAQNAKTHSAEQVKQIAASISEFGWTNPVLVDEENEIIAGHGRVLAAELLALDEVPTITLSGLSEVQKRAYRLADNKIPLNAGWDNDLLRIELEELSELNVDLDLTGFNQYEICALMPLNADDPAEHWSGMPLFSQPDATAHRQLIVNFENDIDVAAFAQLVGQQLTSKTKFIWFPEHMRDVLKDKAFMSDET